MVKNWREVVGEYARVSSCGKYMKGADSLIMISSKKLIISILFLLKTP